MSTERDTKFQGFAELLFQELNKNDLLDLNSYPIPIDDFPKTRLAKQIIAQRAYDLVAHVVEDINYGLDTHTVEDAVATIPDLTAWPIPPASAPRDHVPD